MQMVRGRRGRRQRGALGVAEPTTTVMPMCKNVLRVIRAPTCHSMPAVDLTYLSGFTQRHMPHRNGRLSGLRGHRQ